MKALLLTGADVNVSSKPASTTNSKVNATNIGKIVKEHDGKLHEQVCSFQQGITLVPLKHFPHDYCIYRTSSSVEHLYTGLVRGKLLISSYKMTVI